MADGNYCGEINGTNSYGAYAGYKKFVSDGITVLVEGEHPSALSIPEMTGYYQKAADVLKAYRWCKYGKSADEM